MKWSCRAGLSFALLVLIDKRDISDYLTEQSESSALLYEKVDVFFLVDRISSVIYVYL